MTECVERMVFAQLISSHLAAGVAFGQSHVILCHFLGRHCTSPLHACKRQVAWPAHTITHTHPRCYIARLNTTTLLTAQPCLGSRVSSASSCAGRSQEAHLPPPYVTSAPGTQPTGTTHDTTDATHATTSAVVHSCKVPAGSDRVRLWRGACHS